MWPKTEIVTHVQGIGETQSLEQSSHELSWKDGGQKGTFRTYIVPHLPINLWGRDIMTLTREFLYSSNAGLLPDQPVGMRMREGLILLCLA